MNRIKPEKEIEAIRCEIQAGNVAKRSVISCDCLPTRLPLVFTVVMWLALDRLDAPGWAQGVAWTIASIMWVVAVISIYEQKQERIPGFGKID